jgi:hypothetical protein
MKKSLPVLALMLIGTAMAQSTALPTTDPSKLGADVGALAATLLFVVQFIKRQKERTKKPFLPWQTLLLTFALGEGAAALLFYSGYGARFGSAPPPYTWIFFGAVAAAVAAGIKDLYSSGLERGKTTVNVTTPVAPATEAPVLTPTVADPSTLPGFQPGTVEDVLRATGEWPAIPGLDNDAPLAGPR